MDPVEFKPVHAISPSAFAALLGRPDTPLILDVRRTERFELSLALMQSLRASPTPLIRKRPNLGVFGHGGSRWGTRSQPRIDRIACPWLIRRFIDRDAVCFCLPTSEVLAVSLGRSRLCAEDDHAMLEAMMPVHDALCTWCVDQVGDHAETHNGRPP
jgi:hypothetical protein